MEVIFPKNVILTIFFPKKFCDFFLTIKSKKVGLTQKKSTNFNNDQGSGGVKP
jgi:hypothetical protein